MDEWIAFAKLMLGQGVCPGTPAYNSKNVVWTRNKAFTPSLLTQTKAERREQEG